MFAQTNVVRNGLFGETAFLHFFTQGMKLSVKNPLFSSASWRRWTTSSEISWWQLGWDRAKSWRKVNFSIFPSHKTARIRCDWKISASSFRELLIMIRFCCTDTSGILSFRGRALPVKDKDSAPKITWICCWPALSHTSLMPLLQTLIVRSFSRKSKVLGISFIVLVIIHSASTGIHFALNNIITKMRNAVFYPPVLQCYLLDKQNATRNQLI